jgi:hypothetical protein
MDVANVRIGQLTGGVVMRAEEMSKTNCLSGIVLYGSVGYVAEAGGMSTRRLTQDRPTREPRLWHGKSLQCRQLFCAANCCCRGRNGNKGD